MAGVNRCPLCSSKSSYYQVRDPHKVWQVKCGTKYGPSGCGLSLTGDTDEPRETLIARWNRLGVDRPE